MNKPLEGNPLEGAIGLSLPRLEAVEKALGQARFTEDLVLPGMLHGALLTSPHPHARIRGYDISAALALPGVKAVVTGDDFETRYMGLVVKDETALAKDKVRYIGEPVAAVAAVDAETARAAVHLIEVDYEELPAVFTPEEAMAPGAPLLHEDYGSYFKIFDAVHDGNMLSKAEIVGGDPDAAMAKADRVFENVYELSAQYHAYMEPGVALAQVDPDGRVTVWSSTQSVFRTQANIAESLGIPMAKIRCISPRIGGGFGGKSEATVQPVAVLLAQKAGRPVRIALSRDEDMTAMRSRHPARVTCRTGVMNDGTIVARHLDILMDGGAYADDSPAVMMLAAYFGTGPYRIPNYRLGGRAVYTNKLRAGAFRGFGNPQATFATEAQLDEIAGALGIDPFELRLKNALQPGDRWIDGHAIDSCTITDCLEALRDGMDWPARRAKAAAAARPGRRRGIGIAAVAHLCGFMATSAFVRLLEDGSVALNTGAVDIGQGSNTALTQICAAALGLSPDQVRCVDADTDTAPYNSGTNASRVTYMVGRAIGEAADVVRSKILEHAGEMLEAHTGDLELLPGGRVAIKGVPGKTISFQEVSIRAHWATGGPIMGTGSFVYEAGEVDPKVALTKGFMSFNGAGAYTFAAQAVELEVDEVTGQVEVLEVWSAHDVGRAVNPGAVDGQIQGGVVQALGYALTEEMVWADGRLANPSFMDYKIPGTMDVPYGIHAIVLEKAEPTHPFGAKGVGEPPIIGIAPAVSSAIHDATGKRLRRSPMTPERVFRALAGEGDGVGIDWPNGQC
ncbi:xanthine dehydrogenase family protein molybdopterin-binding subunit [Marinibaculum pumilum]|uniref:Xanthine dehydrogenase family protein molybdopterin-binding subunit n=1 Tax=Marinibaculum pumilum TaxID=1766165 RepID=A0ABV7L230_9PROT